MVKVKLLGLIIEDMRESIKMIKNMVREHLNGQMDENLLDNGKMVNNME